MIKKNVNETYNHLDCKGRDCVISAAYSVYYRFKLYKTEDLICYNVHCVTLVIVVL